MVNTTSEIRPRRSVLYLPGSNARALEKAAKLPSDCLIFDLEDAVAAASKVNAREEVTKAFRRHHYGLRERIIRVNGLDTPWGEEDMTFAAALEPEAILFPKVSSARQVSERMERLDGIGATNLSVWLMIETPQSIINVESIATTSSRIGALVLGTSDLVKETRARHTPERENLAFALQRSVLAARAAGIDVIDGVHLDFRNQQAFVQSCEAGRDMGFDGKTLIHPTQIEPANSAFGYSQSDREHAKQVLETWHDAQQSGKGVAELNGQLIENMHAEQAQRVMEYLAVLDQRAAEG